ncbi:MAG: chitosanase [Tetrasphaera sp.]
MLGSCRLRTPIARNCHRLLGAAYLRAWRGSARLTAFRRAQTDERDRVYWAPALAQARRDGVGPLGLAIRYDISVNHGPGADWQSFGGIVAAAAD